jgi:hypothetical protein
MVEKLGVEESKVEKLCSILYKNYGTTLAGLRAIGYKLDYDDYHRYMHHEHRIKNPFLVPIFFTTMLEQYLLCLACSFVHGSLPYHNIKPDTCSRAFASGS